MRSTRVSRVATVALTPPQAGLRGLAHARRRRKSGAIVQIARKKKEMSETKGKMSDDELVKTLREVVSAVEISDDVSASERERLVEAIQEAANRLSKPRDFIARPEA